MRCFYLQIPILLAAWYSCHSDFDVGRDDEHEKRETRDSDVDHADDDGHDSIK